MTTNTFMARDGGALGYGVYAWTVEHVSDQDILTGRRAAKGYVLLLR